MNKTWTDAEIEFLKKFSGKMSDEDTVKVFNKTFRVGFGRPFKSGVRDIDNKPPIDYAHPLTLDALRKKRQRLGIKKGHGRGHYERITEV